MSKIKNMEIEINENATDTINLISSFLGLNWSRENAETENRINQFGFRYTNNDEDISIWFIERDGVLTTTNVVPGHTNEISIERCNDLIELFGEQNLFGRVKYSII